MAEVVETTSDRINRELLAGRKEANRLLMAQLEASEKRDAVADERHRKDSLSQEKLAELDKMTSGQDIAIALRGAETDDKSLKGQDKEFEHHREDDAKRTADQKAAADTEEARVKREKAIAQALIDKQNKSKGWWEKRWTGLKKGTNDLYTTGQENLKKQSELGNIWSGAKSDLSLITGMLGPLQAIPGFKTVLSIIKVTLSLLGKILMRLGLKFWKRFIRRDKKEDKRNKKLDFQASRDKGPFNWFDPKQDTKSKPEPEKEKMGFFSKLLAGFGLKKLFFGKGGAGAGGTAAKVGFFALIWSGIKWAFGLIFGKKGLIVTVFKFFLGRGGLIRLLFMNLGRALLFFTGPVGATIAAILTVGYLIYTYWDEIKQAFKNFGEGWNNFMDALGTAWDGMKTAIGDWFTRKKESIKSKAREVRDFGKELWAAVTDWWDGFIESVKDTFRNIGTFAKNLWSGSKAAVGTAVGAVSGAAAATYNVAEQTAGKIGGAVAASGQAIADTTLSVRDAVSEIELARVMSNAGSGLLQNNISTNNVNTTASYFAVDTGVSDSHAMGVARNTHP